MPATCQLEGAQAKGELPPASGEVSYYREGGRWFRLDHGDATAQPARPSISYSARCDGAWQLLEISGDWGRFDSLTLRPPVALELAEPRDDLLVGAGVRWSCLTDAGQNRRLRCLAGDSFDAGAGQIHRMRVRGDRLSGPAGAALPDFEFELHTIKPSLRIEPNPARLTGYELLVLAPMALQESALREALAATIDERPVRLRLEASSPVPPLNRVWAYQHPWPAQQFERELRWEAPAATAWRLRLERTPKAGQRVQLWLRGPLLSSGGHSGPSTRADFASLLYQESVPEELSISLLPPEWPSAAWPALLFSRPPAPATLQRLVDTLPGPVHSYPALLEPVLNRGPHTNDPRGQPHQQGWRLPLLGGPPASAATLGWRKGKGVLGERLSAGELDLDLLGTRLEGPDARSDSRLSVPEPHFSLHAIELAEQWLVVASDARSGRGLSGVQLSDGSGEPLVLAPTDSAGLQTLPRELAGRDVIRGRLGDATVDLQLTAASSAFGSGSLGWAEPYFWWSDAPAYSAEAPVRFVAIARQAFASPSTAASPIQASLQDRGQPLADIELRPDRFGLLRGQVNLPPAVPGTSTLQARSIQLASLSSHQILPIDDPEQVADQPAASLQLAAGEWIAGHPRTLAVNAHYADGRPAAGVALSVSALATPAYGDPLAARHPGFRFRDPSSHQQDWQTCGSPSAESRANADEQGRAELTVNTPPGCEVSRLSLTLKSGSRPKTVARLPVGWSFAHARQLGLSGWRSHLPPGEASFRVLAVDLAAEQVLRPAEVRLQALRVDGGGVERHTCRLRGDGVDACRIRFRSEGLYRLILEAPGYPTRQFRQAVGAAHALPAGPAPLPVMRLQDRHLRHGQPIEWSLTHEYPRARVLALLSGRRLRAAQWLEAPDDPAEPMRWLPPDDVSGCLRLSLLVLPVVPADEPPRQARLITEPLCLAPPRPALLSWAVNAAPDALHVKLASHSERELALVLRAVDSRWLDWSEQDGRLQAWLDRGSALAGPASLATSLLDGVDPLVLPACGLEFEKCRTEVVFRHYRPTVVESFRAPAALNAEAAAAPVQVLAWVPDIYLAPGESRTLDIPLPSHPASWRVEVIALDGAGGFEELKQVVPATRR